MLPVLDPRRCCGTGDCVRVCPTQCLSASPPASVVLVRPGDCISCGLCAAVCPEQALRLPTVPSLSPGEATFEPLDD
jgi:NAD-dependent dihydropyrimidine dehydrogenase PreA subunit